MDPRSITVTELYQLSSSSQGLGFIDVREKDEYSNVATPLAENFPLSSFNPDLIAKKYDKANPIYIICHSGMRSARAGEVLAAAGFENVFNVTGGMRAWEIAGLPVKRGP